MNVALERVSANDVRLQRLLQLYLHEWSARVRVPIGPDALYTYPKLAPLDAYLFLDIDAGVPVGFALTYLDDRGTQHVEEMFVIAGARRSGVGRGAMQQLFAVHPGPWTLTVRPENPEGLAFWRRTTAEFESIAIDEREERGADGIVRTRFSFTMPARWQG
ncbi:GNAT family N-acetyltransferase [Sorangium sp. So ce861]|uniref:GNAT family N-acetyltransferase n=1 Tax=Sorangium sp. So ce861 TaxID=3133323 RepID=UPI003F5F385C